MDVPDASQSGLPMQKKAFEDDLVDSIVDTDIIQSRSGLPPQ